MKRIVIGVAFIALLSTSCKKDAEAPSTPTTITPTKENLTGSYLLGKVTIVTGTSQEADATNLFFPEACDRDNVFKLNADLSFEFVDAGVQCDNGYSGSWSFTNSSTVVVDGDIYTMNLFRV